MRVSFFFCSLAQTGRKDVRQNKKKTRACPLGVEEGGSGAQDKSARHRALAVAMVVRVSVVLLFLMSRELR